MAIGLLFQESSKCQGQEAEAMERKELLMKAVAAVRQVWLMDGVDRQEGFSLSYGWTM